MTHCWIMGGTLIGFHNENSSIPEHIVITANKNPNFGQLADITLRNPMFVNIKSYVTDKEEYSCPLKAENFADAELLYALIFCETAGDYLKEDY